MSKTLMVYSFLFDIREDKSLTNTESSECPLFGQKYVSKTGKKG